MGLLRTCPWPLIVILYTARAGKGGFGAPGSLCRKALFRRVSPAATVVSFNLSAFSHVNQAVIYSTVIRQAPRISSPGPQTRLTMFLVLDVNVIRTEAHQNKIDAAKKRSNPPHATSSEPSHQDLRASSVLSLTSALHP